MSKQKRIRLDDPYTERNLFEDRRLSAAFVELAADLPRRPAASASRFENVAGSRARYRGHDAVAAGKDVIREAVALGDTEVLDQTAARVRAFCRELERAMLTDYTEIASGVISMPDAMARASKETTEALHAIVRTALPSIGDYRECTLREIAEAREALAALEVQLIADTHRAERRPRRLVLS